MSHDAETIDFLARAIYAWDGGNWGHITDGFRQIKRRHAAELAIALGDRLRPAPRVIETIRDPKTCAEGSLGSVILEWLESAFGMPTDLPISTDTLAAILRDAVVTAGWRPPAPMPDSDIRADAIARIAHAFYEAEVADELASTGAELPAWGRPETDAHRAIADARMAVNALGDMLATPREPIGWSVATAPDEELPEATDA